MEVRSIPSNDAVQMTRGPSVGTWSVIESRVPNVALKPEGQIDTLAQILLPQEKARTVAGSLAGNSLGERLRCSCVRAIYYVQPVFSIDFAFDFNIRLRGFRHLR